jgi:hypothetical protein
MLRDLESKRQRRNKKRREEAEKRKKNEGRDDLQVRTGWDGKRKGSDDCSKRHQAVAN